MREGTYLVWGSHVGHNHNHRHGDGSARRCYQRLCGAPSEPGPHHENKSHGQGREHCELQQQGGHCISSWADGQDGVQRTRTRTAAVPQDCVGFSLSPFPGSAGRRRRQRRPHHRCASPAQAGSNGGQLRVACLPEHAWIPRVGSCLSHRPTDTLREVERGASAHIMLCVDLTEQVLSPCRTRRGCG
eukprot:scaffold30415_cov124-Isochrysis_galbana.AAC.4